MIFDRILSPARNDRYMPNSRRDCFLDDVLNERLVHERKHFLRLSFRRRQKTRAESCSRKNSFGDLQRHYLPLR